MGWSGGGHGNVPCTSCVICLCCYAAEISGVVATLYFATLQRSLVLLLRCVHEGVGWGGWGGACKRLLRTLYVATLQRSLVLLLRCVEEGVGGAC